ncbi:MAG: DUF4339 domain-containing protein [Planctomycetales bacterium]|nr:DUF4339 domain-containing protein [Planctomycetales bacterium]
MATNWYWRGNDGEQGPYTFQTLASMLRDKILNEDDLVRPSYSAEWQTTDSVIGLFNMAKRIPVERAEARPTSSIADIENAEPLLQAESEKIWEYKLEDVVRERDLSKGSVLKRSAEDSNGITHSALSDLHDFAMIGSVEIAEFTELATAIAAAADAWDSRHEILSEEDNRANNPANSFSLAAFLVRFFRHGRDLCFYLVAPFISVTLRLFVALGRVIGFRRICLRVEQIASRQSLAIWFRAGISLAMAGIIAFGIVRWSEHRDLRFPDPERLATGKKTFPLYGPCAPLEYSFLVFDAAILSGVFGYFTAKWIESRSEG